MKEKNAFVIFVGILVVIFLLAFLVMLIYLGKSIRLFNLNDSGNVNILTNSLVALGTISLALATFYSLFEAKTEEDKKQKALLSQFNSEHLSDIKENCLSPMLRLINDYYYQIGMFEISEQNKFDDASLQNIIDSPTHSWDKEVVYGMNYRAIVNNKLYKDLENHKITEGIPAEFDKVLELISINCPVYRKNLKELFIKIKNPEEFKQIVSRIEQKYTTNDVFDVFFLNDRKNDYTRLIILLSLDYSDIKHSFPNYFNMAYNDKEYENVKKIGDIFKSSNEAKEVLSIKNKVKTGVESLRGRINSIMDLDALDDECDYLKQKRTTLSI
jgi:hypothetical protein